LNTAKFVLKRTGRFEREKLEEKYKNLIKTNRSLSRKLVSFQANKKIPFYSWFAFKEGFSSRMVKMFIKGCSKNSGAVLDPFSGSGTTLFSSREMGFNPSGIEVMPIGEFVLKSRIATENADMDQLIKEIEKLKKLNFLNLPVDNETNYKHIAITKKAFPDETEQKLNAFLNYIEREITDENIKKIFKFACFCILEKISYTRKDGQCLRWDYRSKKGKSIFDKGKIYDFEEALFGQLNQIISDIRNLRLFFGSRQNKSSNIELKTGSCLEILPTLKSDSFDLIITSPPYCNRYDYTRTYALELVFLGINEEEIRKLRQNLLSCTVENKEKIDYLKSVYKKNNQLDLFEKAEKAFNSNKALHEVLEILRTYKEEKKLNNPGIYRMVKNYFYEHSFVVFEMARVLKNGGRIYYVNDNVMYAGETIPVDLILSEFAKDAGLKIKKIFKLETGKGNSSQQMGIHGREELRKCVYFWEK